MADLEIAAEEEVTRALRELGYESVRDLPAVPIALPVSPREHVAPVTRIPPTLNSLSEAVGHFAEAAGVARLDLSAAVRHDLLAAYLSSQFLLFAGPSGTGKSTAARLLQDFFTPEPLIARLDSRRQLIGPEELVGYHSPLGGGLFTAGQDLEAVLKLVNETAESPSPSLLVEEINLSPPEGYLGPVVHGLSSVECQWLPWRLYSATALLDQVAPAPPLVELGPYLRVLGTINVDATAPPPARKVVARSCVILMEPIATDIENLVSVTEIPGGIRTLRGTGAPYVGSPTSIFGSDDARPTEAAESCLRIGALVEAGSESVSDPRTKRVSRRQLAQMSLYATWHDMVVRADNVEVGEDESMRAAAENAVLHYVLPQLGGEDLTEALSNLREARDRLTGPSEDGPGGLLLDRVDSLVGASGPDAGLLGSALDYWDRLS